MTGTAVSWGLGAALAMVASVATWRLTRPSARLVDVHQRADSVLHLVMAVAMAAMLVPRVEPLDVTLVGGFGTAAAMLLVRGRLHHAVMSGIMALMIHAPAAMHMAMPVGASDAPLMLVAAFGYAAISACVVVWRRQCAIDPLGRGCEVVMLVSTAVMLLPML